MKAKNTLNEEDVMQLYHTLWWPGPCSPQWPFDFDDMDAREVYFQELVATDLWGNLDVLLKMLITTHERGGHDQKEMLHHLTDLLSAICRLAPEQYFQKIEPYLEQPMIRPSLLWSLCRDPQPQSLEWFKPWVSQLTELSDDEISMVVENIGIIGRDYEKLRVEARHLLEKIRIQVPKSCRLVHSTIDSA